MALTATPSYLDIPCAVDVGRVVAWIVGAAKCPLGFTQKTTTAAHLRQLEESGLKARMSPVSVGYQRDKEDILGGEEGQVVGGREGAT